MRWSDKIMAQMHEKYPSCVPGAPTALRWLLFAGLLIQAFGATTPAAAKRKKAAPVVLVVEAAFDAPKLRQAVAKQLRRPVTNLSRAQRSVDGPQVILTVTVDLDAGITVMYWNRSGLTDFLSAPAPSGQPAMRAVAAALAVALVKQNSRQERRFAQAPNPYLARPWMPECRPPTNQLLNPYYYRGRRR